jgi:hypothetical protein
MRLYRSQECQRRENVIIGYLGLRACFETTNKSSQIEGVGLK